MQRHTIHGLGVLVALVTALTTRPALAAGGPGPMNRPPLLVSCPPAAAWEDRRYHADIQAHDPDPGEDLLLTILRSPKGLQPSGALRMSPTSGHPGRFHHLLSWILANDQIGQHTFTIVVTDRGGAKATRDCSISVLNTNDPPVMTTNPSARATEDQLYSYVGRAKDIDPTGDKLRFGLGGGHPAGMTIRQTGPREVRVEWVPGNSQVGSHAVTLWVEDNHGASSRQTWTVTVANTNDRPTITSFPVTGATTRQPYLYDLEARDPDPTGDRLTYLLVQGPAGMRVDPTTGVTTWTPTREGDSPVKVSVSDGKGGQDSQAWSIKVVSHNAPPRWTSSPMTALVEDRPYTYLVKAADPDGDRLSFSLSASPPGMGLARTAKDEARLSWTPANHQVGRHHVKVVVEDGRGGVAIQSFTLQVANTNDAPRITSSPMATAVEDQGYLYRVTAMDDDPTADKLRFSLRSGPKGLVIDPTIGVVQWLPTNSDVGTHKVSIQVVDGRGGSAVQEFTLQVVNVNDPPTIVSTPPAIATEDIQLSHQLRASDEDVGHSLTFRLSQGPPRMSVDSRSGLLTWTPDNDDARTGSHHVVVSVEDGDGGSASQGFTVRVSNSNDPPAIHSKPITGAAVGRPYSYRVLASDPDPTGDSLAFHLDKAPQRMTIDQTSGLVQWGPALSDRGTHLVAVRVTDGKGGSESQTFSLTVVDRNNPPRITSRAPTEAVQNAAYRYPAAASDQDGDRLGWALELGPGGMTIDQKSGVVEWTPGNSEVGDHRVTIRVDDGKGGVARESLVVVVKNVNDPPVVRSRPRTEATESQRYAYKVAASDPDPPAAGDRLAYSLLTAPSGMKIGGGTGLVEWTPSNGQVGSHQVVVKVEDGKGGVTGQTFTLVVKNVNDPPRITSKPPVGAIEDQPFSHRVTYVDPDPASAGDRHRFVLTDGLRGLTIHPSVGLMRWLPGNADVGKHRVSIRLMDGMGGEATQSFVLDVANTNDPPRISSQPPSGATQGKQYVYVLGASDPDPGGDILSFALDVAPTSAVAANRPTIGGSTGRISWVPSQRHVGSKHLFTVSVSDGKGGATPSPGWSRSSTSTIPPCSRPNRRSCRRNRGSAFTISSRPTTPTRGTG